MNEISLNKVPHIFMQFYLHTSTPFNDPTDFNIIKKEKKSQYIKLLTIVFISILIYGNIQLYN